MSAELLLSHPKGAESAIKVQPVVLTLFDHSTLTINEEVPLTATGRHNAALTALIYFYGGRIDSPTGYYGGYLGQSSDLHGPRPAASHTRWVVNQRRIIPTGMAMLRRDEPYNGDYRRYVEAKSIQRVSAAGLLLLNTQTSAYVASSRLTRAEVLEGERLANDIADAILTHVFCGNVNPHPSPAANTREAAVREVLAETHRGLDTFEIMRRLRASGVTTKGRSWDFSIRRDLNHRERDMRGTPRVVSTSHRGRRIFWGTRTLSKRQALAGYDLAHPS